MRREKHDANYMIRYLMHLAFILAALALTWVPMMNFFGNNVWYTLAGAYVVLFAADQAANVIFQVD
jgi:hypothetical protein